MNFIPTVILKKHSKEYAYDIFSRLLEDRIIMLCGEINDEMASSIVSQLLYLESLDPNADIDMYINSPGGSVSAGLAIFDTMNFVKCDVSTISIGLSASMGAFLLAAGTKGKRYALENSEIMIHQPLGGTNGQASDIEITTKHILKQKEKLNRLLSEMTSQPLRRIKKDTDRDYFMNAYDALEYGLIDEVLKK
ncbi:ATP-dependent Clp protease proteolytic subunit [Candidatus Stoquefichus sp. SB1]|jgi:ATP-dependent Clp protease protease subunit|uniref:ATP-dependent Clp protease proteolytic subunit n=1 Tax=Candidatus Stoquefichus sp. SB1 TaxID=1658109 RepID=UPI00067F1D0A|nr:ATP-dependent Clp protease proteolytic subunit [Candidatus Stoquefichus sp. SB1]